VGINQLILHIGKATCAQDWTDLALQHWFFYPARTL